MGQRVVYYTTDIPDNPFEGSIGLSLYGIGLGSPLATATLSSDRDTDFWRQPSNQVAWAENLPYGFQLFSCQGNEHQVKYVPSVRPEVESDDGLSELLMQAYQSHIPDDVRDAFEVFRADVATALQGIDGNQALVAVLGADLGDLVAGQREDLLFARFYLRSQFLDRQAYSLLRDAHLEEARQLVTSLLEPDIAYLKCLIKDKEADLIAADDVDRLLEQGLQNLRMSLD